MMSIKVANRDGPFVLTPFGEALVEAMPDRKAVEKVKRTFKRSGRCPTTSGFPTQASIRRFYKEHGAVAKKRPRR